ncbi:glycoside hydrolase family 10 protein [Thermoactinospora rubra]|uniref:glycoside hydrolase family 10 protein n=1 Tax=Thermoactinospora rubra TaxID=1088767 RepID=UPI001301BEA9|nr:family 10 glycosylhydrolase [Thermoactinospora rubra]
MRIRGGSAALLAVVALSFPTAPPATAETAPNGAQAAAAEPAPAGPKVIAADGAEHPIHAVDPPSRTGGILALYTPAFQPRTGTNAFGGEAVLRKTTERDVYEVLDVCTALTQCPNPGDNAIPADGAVLSASPGGSPDVRAFLRDHVRRGDRIRLEGLVFKTVGTPVDAVDPTAETNPEGVDPASGRCYPGCRGAEQLVVYTRPGRTGTNAYGFEVTVVNGRVTARGGGDSTVPEGGYVISGHGSRGQWLSANAVLGASVRLEGGKVTVSVDAGTYRLGAEQALATARRGLDDAGASCLPVDGEGARTRIAEAERLLARAAAEPDPRAAADLAQQARREAEAAWYRTRESRPVEGRGIWVRPTETTPEQIERSLDRLQATGINMIFLETLWQGYTIYPSQVAARWGVAAQRPNMAGFDPLKVWIDGAKRRGIELHAWVHTFFAGHQGENKGPGPILTAHPEWAAVEREDVGKSGPQPSSQEAGYYFLDPAIPQARQYVKEIFEEILTRYETDGLHLDYIRYPVSLPYQASFSYSDHSRAEFAKAYGVDPYALTMDDPRWKDWNAWREQRITSFVAEVRELQRRVAPGRRLSAAVFPDPSDGLGKKFQNWAAWVEHGYVDLLTGMAFGTSAQAVADDTARMRGLVGEGNLLYTATYGPMRGSAPEVVLDQVQAVRDAGSDGAALFSYLQLRNDQADALGTGVFRVKARVPHADLPGAARTALARTGEQLAAATGRCVPVETAKDLAKDLAAADRWIRIGKLGRAEAQLARAAGRLRDSSGLEPRFRDRLLRDVTMYDRWLSRAR